MEDELLHSDEAFLCLNVQPEVEERGSEKSD